MKRRIISFWGNRIILFLLAFSVSLFLGDGKQTAIDFYWAFVTVITIPLWEGKKSATAGLGTMLWTLFLLSAGISSLVSWSPAYSVTAFMRLLVAFVWFLRFSSIRDAELIPFVKGLSFCMIILVPLTALALFAPSIAVLLPPLNLIFAPAGHLPIAYIAVPILPVLYVFALREHSSIMWLGFAATILMILGSFSRGAIFLLAAFFVGIVIVQRRKLGALATIGILSSTLVLAAFILRSSTKTLPTLPIVKQYLIKDPISLDARRSYAKEAEEAFRHSPLFGTGPGTFILVSKQFAETPEVISVSAHNILLEMLAEYGIIGTLLFFSLFLYASSRAITLYRSKRALATVRASFGISLILTALLGLVEQNMDRYGVFLLFSISLGILCTGKRRVNQSWKLVYRVVLTVIALYLTSWIASDAAAFIGNDQLSFYFAPYRQQRGVTLLASSPQPLTPQHQRLFSIFYPRDPEIDAVFASYQTTEGDRIAWYKKAMAENPTKMSWELGYLVSLIRVNNVPLLCQELRRFSDSPYLDCLSSSFTKLVNDGTVSATLSWLTPNDGKAKFLYKLGATFLAIHDEQSAIMLWEKARDTAPNWGYYHIELASLVAQHNQTTSAAVPTLLSCLSNMYARAQCEWYLHDLPALPAPGSFAKKIMAIPVRSDIP